MRGAFQRPNADAARAVVAASLLWALGQGQPAAPVSFDVASVKVSTQGWLEMAPKHSGGRIIWTTDLHYLIGYAYRLPFSRISGPIPGSDSIYHLEATTAATATDDQVRAMFQSLLAERFKMVSHPVTKETDCYVLTVAKNGPKLKEAGPDDKAPPLPEWFRTPSVSPSDLDGRVATLLESPGIATITGRRATMFQLSEALQRVMQSVVLDKTGLQGNYYFAVRYADESSPPDADAPSLFAVLQHDLGLKLEKRKEPVTTLVVDHIERVPTEN